jgi:hypothetical protein
LGNYVSQNRSNQKGQENSANVNDSISEKDQDKGTDQGKGRGEISPPGTARSPKLPDAGNEDDNNQKVNDQG